MTRRRPAERDQAPSEFHRILRALVASSGAVVGAVLVDDQGEAVDYAGRLDPFDVKLAGAHLRVVLDEARDASAPLLGGAREMVIQGRRRSLLIRALPEGCALAVVLGRRAGFALSRRALAWVERELAREARWTLSPAGAARRWFPVRVAGEGQDRRRPGKVMFSGEWENVEVMGSVVGLRRTERGWRIRLRTGAELTLVREPLGRWWADEPTLADPIDRREAAPGRGGQ